MDLLVIHYTIYMTVYIEYPQILHTESWMFTNDLRRTNTCCINLLTSRVKYFSCTVLIFWFSKVNTNGDVTFESSLSQFVANSFPISGSHKIIAPFWTDIDIRNGGQLWYRLTTQDLMLEQGTSEIRNLFPHILSFAASWIMVVTWENVAVFGCREVGISCSLVCMYRFTLKVIKKHICFYFHTFWYTSCQKYCKEDI